MGVVSTSVGAIGAVVAGEDRTASGALPILFLHGVGSDKSVWAPQLASFGDRRLAVAADYPGYGESDPIADATREDFAAAMTALLDALDIERAHVCGLSLGGIIAMRIALDAPERIAGLVLADTFAVHPEGRAIHDGSVAASREMGMRALAEARVDRLLGSEPPEGLRAAVVETMARIDPAAYALGARAVWLADLSDAVGAIRHPTLVLCGEEDAVTPPFLSDALAAAIAGARRADIAGAGHLANAERAAAFDGEVSRFLDEIE